MTALYIISFILLVVATVALLKLTPEQIDIIRLASKNGLTTAYSDDRYVYYVSSSGSALDWHGFNGNANDGVSAPYIVCPTHNKWSWDEYESEQQWQDEEQDWMDW